MQKDILEVAVAAGVFSTLAIAFAAADYSEMLRGPGPFTIFAPTDEAFNRLAPGMVRELLNDRKALIRVLGYHVVPGRVDARDVGPLTEAKTAEGSVLSFRVHNGAIFVQGSTRVTTADIPASNGVIHAIDNVLLPPHLSV